MRELDNLKIGPCPCHGSCLTNLTLLNFITVVRCVFYILLNSSSVPIYSITFYSTRAMVCGSRTETTAYRGHGSCLTNRNS